VKINDSYNNTSASPDDHLTNTISYKSVGKLHCVIFINKKKSIIQMWF